MKQQIYKIFKECYPNIPLTEDNFCLLLGYDQCVMFPMKEKNELIGFSAIQGNCIRLLCVKPQFQRKGYGKTLMQKSESYIKREGYDSVVLGGFDSKLFLGATTEESEWNQKHNYFFEKLGYTARNGCLEMVMPLEEYSLAQLNIELYPENITFEYWNKDDKSELITAVKEVVEDWVQYYQHADSIYVAKENGKVVGFTILDFDTVTLCSNGNNKVGMVGCVGVIPSKRNHGIGLAMVAHATNELKKNGSDDSYIHFTYLDQWYGKLGYKTILWYWFGKKYLS